MKTKTSAAAIVEDGGRLMAVRCYNHGSCRRPGERKEDDVWQQLSGTSSVDGIIGCSQAASSSLRQVRSVPEVE